MVFALRLFVVWGVSPTTCGSASSFPGRNPRLLRRADTASLFIASHSVLDRTHHMTVAEFSRIKAATNKEAACHCIFDKASDIWQLEDPDTLTEGQITVICVETFFGEVCNGGIVQYLDNIAGEWAFRGVDSLQRVGLPAYADILKRALHLHHPAPIPTDRKTWLLELEALRDTHLSDSFEDDYDSYDREFFALYHRNRTEFRDRLFSYIVQNEDEFIKS
jgi:hypothetical protein